MPIRTTKSYCRFCHAYCAIEVDVDRNRVIAVRGDASNPVYGGYTCIKGRQLPEQHSHPERLRRSLKRRPDGTFTAIASEQALDEIAAHLARIIEQHGPRSVATYNGTYAFQNSAALAVARAWHEGIDSPLYYTSVTIDQPAKFIAPSRFGTWGAGNHGFESADVVMVIGNNAIISQYSPFGGIPPFNPVKRLRDAKRRGLEVICVDPRRTEVARYADLHLQIKPGEDPTLLAGVLRVIFEENLHDAEFCAAHVGGLDDLRAAVADFTPEYVERRTTLPAALVVEAARLFARGPRGCATTGTGPDMSPRSNLTEHLVLALNTVCGRYNREGEVVPNPSILMPPAARRAQAFDPAPAWGSGPRARVRGLGQIFGEMPAATLSDEILEPGEGQVRALISVGGNPVVAWPDQIKALRAIEALELNVCVDIKMSATARRAHYVIAPKLSLERADVTLLTDSWYERPYAQYTEAVVEPDGDVIEEWELFWGLARRMGTPIKLPGGSLDLTRRPSKFEVLEKITAGSRVPLAEVRRHDGGHVYEHVRVMVEPADPHSRGRLQLAPEGIVEELREVRAEPLSSGGGYGERSAAFSHRLISRRLRHVYNSSGRDLSVLRAKGTTNPAFMNVADLKRIGLESGDLVEISSEHATILGVAQATDELKSGVISMAHAWGDSPENDGQVREIGSSTNRLVNNAADYDPITGMARQSAIPVNVRPATEGPRRPPRHDQPESC